MNSYRRGLLNGALVNPKLFILEKVNFGQHTKCWSNLVKSSQTWSNVLQTCIIWYGSLQLGWEMGQQIISDEDHDCFGKLTNQFASEGSLIFLPNISVVYFQEQQDLF